MANQRASDLQLATALAQASLEQIRSLGFGNDDNATFPSPATAANDTSLAPLHNAKRTITFTGNYGGDAKMLQASVTITWQGRRDKSQSVTLETLVTNRSRHTGT